MTARDDRCQCGRWPEACASRMTQEDLLCDLCRRGRCSVTRIGGDGPALHMEWRTSPYEPAPPPPVVPGYTGVYRLYPNKMMDQELFTTRDLPG